MTGQRTLEDYLGPGLRLVSVGLNPSLNSVRAGFYFATPRNRFWHALNASRLISAPVSPGPGVEARLLRHEGIGFTDVVKRPSAGARDLRASDFREWAPVLRDRLLAHRPRCAWFHGKVAYTNFLRHTGIADPAGVDWGLQPTSIGEVRVFVTPNPSPANAAFSLAEIVAWYDRLAELE